VFVDSCHSAEALSVSFLITILDSGDDNTIDACLFVCVCVCVCVCGVDGFK